MRCRVILHNLVAFRGQPRAEIGDDLAGGALLAAILAQHLCVRSVLFDQPHVVASAATVLGAAGRQEPVNQIDHGEVGPHAE